ncbi:PAS domain S-box protein [Sulfuricurvum sp.]|uniref:PAS domain S-box protein n=1 Tax=Sulfuricurvum sp. TaxID=2025608 RepID=UPI003C5BC2FB
MVKNFFKWRRKNFFFQLAVLFVPLAVGIIGIAVYSYQAEKKQEFRIVALHERTVVKMGKSAMLQALDKLKNDVQYLSQYHDFEDYIATGSSENLKHLTYDFKLLMQNRRVYDQLRWIDESGMERLRINFNNGFPTFIPSEELQNKKNRYYVSEAMQFREGETYFSLFDLNIDHEKIEVPYKPMIRAATPIVNKEGDKKGIFIINYLGDELIQKFAEVTAISNGDAMLLNGEGYWLKGMKKSDEWGFMFNRDDLSLSHRYPSAWQRIAKAEEGQFVDEQGLWTFTTVHPLVNALGIIHPNDKKSVWKAVILLPSDKLYVKTNTMLIYFSLFTLLGLAAVGIGSFTLAFLYRKKQLAIQELSDLHRRTEGILHSVPDMIMQVDSDKRYVWANDIGIEFFGEEVIGKEASFYFEGEQGTYAMVQPLVTDENQAVYVESWQRRRDGEKRLLAWWCQTLKDEEGRPTGVLSTARDITDQKKVQNEADKLSKAIEQIDDIVYITDKVGNISYVNGAYCRHTGYTQEEVIGQN